RSVITKHFRNLLTTSKSDIDATGGLSDFDRGIYLTSLQVADQAIKTDTPLALAKPDDDTLAFFINQNKIPITKGSEQYRLLERDFNRAFRSYLNERFVAI